jgi:Family of unknown function (DUF6941)
MNPPPIAVALMLCKYVHFEEGDTHNVTLVGCFSKLDVVNFPQTPSFYVYAALTNAQGESTIRIVVERLDTGEDVYAYDHPVRFPDKLATMHLSKLINKCVFPVDGWYHMILYADGQWVAQRRFKVTKR